MTEELSLSLLFVKFGHTGLRNMLTPPCGVQAPPPHSRALMLNCSFLIMTCSNTHHGLGPSHHLPWPLSVTLVCLESVETRALASPSTQNVLPYTESCSLISLFLGSLLASYTWFGNFGSLGEAAPMPGCPHWLPVHQRCSPEIPQANTGRGFTGKRDGGQQEGRDMCPFPLRISHCREGNGK